MIKDIMNKIKQNRFYINYSRMWPYVKPVWFRALCSMLICIPIGSLDAVIALALKPYMDLVMVEKSVTVQFEMDMETHPIAHLVQEASQYKSSVYLEKDNKKVNAKSIMGMMSLTLEKGSSLKVVADGKDEEKAVKGIENFLTTP